MNAHDAIKSMLGKSSVSMRSASQGMGKSDSFIFVTLKKRSTPQCSTMAAIAAQCGYRLALIPDGQILPPGTIIID